MAPGTWLIPFNAKDHGGGDGRDCTWTLCPKAKCFREARDGDDCHRDTPGRSVPDHPEMDHNLADFSRSPAATGERVPELAQVALGHRALERRLAASGVALDTRPHRRAGHGQVHLNVPAAKVGECSAKRNVLMPSLPTISR